MVRSGFHLVFSEPSILFPLGARQWVPDEFWPMQLNIRAPALGVAPEKFKDVCYCVT